MVTSLVCYVNNSNAYEDRIMDKAHNRNEPCPCGSGKKYKKCCGVVHQARRQMKAKVMAQGPIGAIFNQVTQSMTGDFFKNSKITQIQQSKNMTALDSFKEKQKKSVEEKV